MNIKEAAELTFLSLHSLCELVPFRTVMYRLWEFQPGDRVACCGSSEERLFVGRDRDHGSQVWKAVMGWKNSREEC